MKRGKDSALFKYKTSLYIKWLEKELEGSQGVIDVRESMLSLNRKWMREFGSTELLPDVLKDMCSSKLNEFKQKLN